MFETARQIALKDFDPKTGAVKLHPFKKPNVWNRVSIEPNRREQEFNIIREVQKTVANYNRVIVLSISTGFMYTDRIYLDIMVYWSRIFLAGRKGWLKLELFRITARCTF